MTKFKEYITDPKNIIAFIIFCFWLGGMWATMNNRLTLLEEKCHEVDTVKAQMYEIQTSLAQIQTDIQWIKSNLSK
jgi:hypothetical protein